ncbi:19488_t:CDS:1, partial [Dentiscutata erythropus]
KINETKEEEVNEINGKEDSLPVYFEQQYDWFNLQANRINRNTRKPLIVGVFQNQPLDEIIKIVDHLKLDLVQLHGEETLEMSRFIPLPVIKAFHIDESFSNPTLVSQPGYNALSLLDTK